VVAGLGKNDRSKNERSLANLRGEALAVSLRENLKVDERQGVRVCGGGGMFDDDGWRGEQSKGKNRSAVN
jgi:hypothetical protein